MVVLKLLTSDKQIFKVDYDVIKCSNTIRQMAENLGLEDNKDDVIPLQKINAALLKKILTWATYHKNDAPFQQSTTECGEKRTDDMCAWDTVFLDVDHRMLFELLMAANFLDIKGLLDITCKVAANQFKGKCPEEIRTTFNIKNDFTLEEEEQIRKENEWCEEK